MNLLALFLNYPFPTIKHLYYLRVERKRREATTKKPYKSRSRGTPNLHLCVDTFYFRP